MAVRDVFHKRLEQAARAGKPEVYEYDELPGPLRAQIVHIVREMLGRWITQPELGRWRVDPPTNVAWTDVRDALARELGRFHLCTKPLAAEADCLTFVLEGPLPDVMSLIELVIRRAVTLQTQEPEGFWPNLGIELLVPDAIEELNHRFREHCVGYQFDRGRVVRVDSQLVHAEVVVPALRLLSAPGFEGPEQEFRAAHGHYRAGEYRDAITDANSAFESTMKAILTARGIGYDPAATARPLVAEIFKHRILPLYLETHLAGTRSALENGVNTLRNKEGGHGQGAEIAETPGYLAAFALHLAAASIVLLAEAHRATPTTK